MYQELAARQQQTVTELLQDGKTREKALEVAMSAYYTADHVIARFEAANTLPSPPACSPGCDFCCHNQVEVTPPEALLIGAYLEQHVSPRQLGLLLERLERNLSLRAGKSKVEVASFRQDLPCPLLHRQGCSIYPVRPLVCRAMHALDAAQCEAALRTQDQTPVAYYAHRHEITTAIVRGLLEGCRAAACQAHAVDLVQALYDYFQQDEPALMWIQGKEVFRRANSIRRGGRHR